MTLNQTMLAIAVTVALMFVGVQNSHAQDLGTLPMPEPDTAPEIIPPQIQLPPVYRVNRDIPCTEFAMVKAILESQNQSPIAQGRARNPDEVFVQLVVTHNPQTAEFNIIIVNADNTVACNIYTGLGFMPVN